MRTGRRSARCQDRATCDVLTNAAGCRSPAVHWAYCSTCVSVVEGPAPDRRTASLYRPTPTAAYWLAPQDVVIIDCRIPGSPVSAANRKNGDVRFTRSCSTETVSSRRVYRPFTTAATPTNASYIASVIIQPPSAFSPDSTIQGQHATQRVKQSNECLLKATDRNGAGGVVHWKAYRRINCTNV